MKRKVAIGEVEGGLISADKVNKANIIKVNEEKAQKVVRVSSHSRVKKLKIMEINEEKAQKVDSVDSNTKEEDKVEKKFACGVCLKRFKLKWRLK